MTISSLSVDDFHPSPEAIAIVAKSLDYTEREHDGHKYKGIGTGYSPEGAAELLGAIMGRDVKIDMEYFRLGLSTGDITNYIHADSGISSMAAVWYLTDAPAGVTAGTAFWRHKKTGLEGVPSFKWMEESGYSPEDLETLFVADNMDESKWEMTGLIGQKFNRIAIYPTSRFHSRYPKQAWGTSVKDGRIAWTAFFRTL